MRPRHGGTISRLCAFRRDHSEVRRRHRERARHCVGAAAACVARRATEWRAFAIPTLPGGPSYRFSALRGCTAHPVRSFRSRVMAGGLVVDRFGPFACIDARDRLPSVAATREHVPPILPAVKLAISRKRSDHRAAVEALTRVLNLGEQLPALPHQVQPTTKKVSRRAHGRRIDVGLRQRAAP